MSYAANLKNVMSMQSRQKEAEETAAPQEETDSSKPGPSAHDLAAQLKSSLLAEIGLTECEGPPLTSFRYFTSFPVLSFSIRFCCSFQMSKAKSPSFVNLRTSSLKLPLHL